MTNNSYLQDSNFKLVINRLDRVSYFSQTANIPSISIQPGEIAIPGGRVFTPGTKIEYSPFSVTFKVDENLENYIELYNWFKEMAPPETGGEVVKEKTSDATLYTLTNKQNPNKLVVFKDMFPISMSDVIFNSTSESIVYPEVTVTFQYRMFDVR